MMRLKRCVVCVCGILVLAASFAVPTTAEVASKAYLIASAAPLTDAQVAQLQNAGANLKYVFRNFGGAAGTMSDKSLAKVRALSFVTSVTRDGVKQVDSLRASLSTNLTPLPGAPYWHDLIDLEKNTTYDGSGVWVAVVDTGFYPNWRDYFNESSILTNLATAFVGILGNPNDNQWDVGSDPHGMAVAGTVIGYHLRDKEDEGGYGQGFLTGASGSYWVPGVAPGAKIIPIKVCEPIGCFASASIAAFDYVTRLKKANPTQPIVVNFSIGGPSLNPVEQVAIDAMIKAGVVMVGSAGNSGTAGMGFPNAYEPVISVGAGGWNGQFADWPRNTWWINPVPEDDMSQIHVASYSSRQKSGQYLDVVSTGDEVLLPYPCAQFLQNPGFSRKCASKASPDAAQSAPFQYLFLEGTSFASPTVAGIVALMLDKNGSLNNADATPTTPGQLERLLEGAATTIPPGSATFIYNGSQITETWDSDATGHGWVFVNDALSAVQ